MLPRAQFKPADRPAADTLANIAFVSDQSNSSVGAASPDVYLRELPRKTLVSQCVPTAPELWPIREAEAFWDARRELLAEAFNEFLDARFERRNLGKGA